MRVMAARGAPRGFTQPHRVIRRDKPRSALTLCSMISPRWRTDSVRCRACAFWDQLPNLGTIDKKSVMRSHDLYEKTQRGDMHTTGNAFYDIFLRSEPLLVLCGAVKCNRPETARIGRVLFSVACQFPKTAKCRAK